MRRTVTFFSGIILLSILLVITAYAEDQTRQSLSPLTYSISVPYITTISGENLYPVMADVSYNISPLVSVALRAGFNNYSIIDRDFTIEEDSGLNPYFAAEYRILPQWGFYSPYIGLGYFMKQTSFDYGERKIVQGPYSTLALLRGEFFQSRSNFRLVVSLLEIRVGSLIPDIKGAEQIKEYTLSSWHYTIDPISIGVKF